VPRDRNGRLQALLHPAARKPMPLEHPQIMTLPLPAPTSKPQDTVPFPTLQLKVIPVVGADNPRPAVAQLIGARWKISGDFHSAEGITVAMHPSEEDPLGTLPVLRVVGGTYTRGQHDASREGDEGVGGLSRRSPCEGGLEVSRFDRQRFSRCQELLVITCPGEPHRNKRVNTKRKRRHVWRQGGRTNSSGTSSRGSSATCRYRRRGRAR
jgi:hypothetical protein